MLMGGQDPAQEARMTIEETRIRALIALAGQHEERTRGRDPIWGNASTAEIATARLAGMGYVR